MRNKITSLDKLKIDVSIILRTTEKKVKKIYKIIRTNYLQLHFISVHLHPV